MSDKDDIKEHVIPKEEAVFWMDGRGRWCNRHGPFEHPKIIAYFNSAIGKDSQGYFVEQILDGWRDKVYFRYKDTPLFVVDVSDGESLTLSLNTGRRIELDPTQLFIRGDHLYVNIGDEYAKFGERALILIADWIQYDQDRAFFCRGQMRVEIPEN
jgi:hypothetical protein